MEKYQIVDVAEAGNHAGTKANADIAAVADRLGFRRLSVKTDSQTLTFAGRLKRQQGYLRDWKAIRQAVPEGAVLLLQHPFHLKQLSREKTLRYLKYRRNARIIALVHDVEELRGYRYNTYYAGEFRTMLELADVYVVHNEVMKQWFMKQGVAEERLITLEIFDYLQEHGGEKQVSFERSVTIAGNLDTNKSRYLGQLGALKGVRVCLYGPNYDTALSGAENVEYCGNVAGDVIPDKLERGFGLVWDGESIDGCKGPSGEYLRYNNPHKLSLYLSSGLPVVIWKEAAEAGFVREHGVGLLIECLQELPAVLDGITEAKYREMAGNVATIAGKLQRGAYAEAALNKALGRIGR